MQGWYLCQLFFLLKLQVLFKNLGVDMKEVKPSSLLKDRVREVQGNPDFSNKDVTASQPQVIAEVNSGVMPTMNLVEMQPDVNSAPHLRSHPNILTQVVVYLFLLDYIDGFVFSFTFTFLLSVVYFSPSCFKYHGV